MHATLPRDARSPCMHTGANSCILLHTHAWSCIVGHSGEWTFRVWYLDFGGKKSAEYFSDFLVPGERADSEEFGYVVYLAINHVQREI